jgi:hypothetical protein
MIRHIIVLLLTAIALIFTNETFADNYPDQHHVSLIEDLSNRIESQSGVKLSDDGTCLELADSVIYGYVILNPDTAEYPFNRGLPSWNGTAPFNPTTTIPFTIPQQTDVKIAIYDVRGRLIETLYEQTTHAGSHIIIWNAENLASGNYFIVFSTSNFYKVMKAILVR